MENPQGMMLMLHKQESKSKGEKRVKGKTHLDLETPAASALSRAEFPAPQQLRNFAQHIGFAACRTNSQILLSNFMNLFHSLWQSFVLLFVVWTTVSSLGDSVYRVALVW
ncbi:MAG TPA: hypothetical protein VGJ66_17025 [Pyrinomonadaceae bacterium]|jgi:hypothetical protein